VPSPSAGSVRKPEHAGLIKNLPEHPFRTAKYRCESVRAEAGPAT